tara:strand:+ start:1245 stop:1445 length:201 start_codon:yes stop_codon:yes gene_type:complete
MKGDGQLSTFGKHQDIETGNANSVMNLPMHHLDLIDESGRVETGQDAINEQDNFQISRDGKQFKNI